MRFRNVVPIPILVLLLLGTWSVQKNDVRIEHDPPDRLPPGGSREVTVRIHKGERNGFAKLELHVPDCLTVKAVEKSGASFTFEDGVAKFIWMAMPKGNSFLVKYRLKANKGTEEGTRSIEGDFRYLEDNKRKRVDVAKSKIRIEKGSAPETKNAEEDEGDTLARDTSSEVDVERRVKKVKEGIFQVRATIRKGSTEDFGKLVERIPEGFKAIPMEEKGSSFTFQDQKAKFVWMSLPRKPSFQVLYRLVSSTATPGTYRVKGSFSYLKEGDSRSDSLEALKIRLDTGKEMKAEAGPADTAGSLTDTSDRQAKKEEDEDARTTKESEDSSITNVPDPQKGVDYRVQICAGHDAVKKDHFQKVYGYEGEYDIDHHEGWRKYLTGTFEQYNKARDKRVYFRENFDLPGPFVTAYNEGERISVQKALMITDQDWVQ
ncbi:MAG: hypothetical protein ABEH38_02105 [Flavobacteriales bacterium]